MKKLILVAAVFVFAAASAFTTKLVNPIGWANDASGNPVSAPTNESGCALNRTNLCSITVNQHTLSPAYDSKADIGVSGKELEFN